MWPKRKEHLYERHDPTKFSELRGCGSEDLMVLVCHVISQNHVIKEKVIWLFG